MSSYIRKYLKKPSFISSFILLIISLSATVFIRFYENYADDCRSFSSEYGIEKEIVKIFLYRGEIGHRIKKGWSEENLYLQLLKKW